MWCKKLASYKMCLWAAARDLMMTNDAAMLCIDGLIFSLIFGFHLQ